MKISRKTLAVLILLAWPGTVFSGAGMEFLNIGTGTRQSGMGGVSPITGDVTAILYNPACIALMENREVSLTHMAWFEGISYDCLNFADPLNDIAAGGNVSVLRYGSMQGYDADGLETGAVSAQDIMVVMSAGKNVSRWEEKDTGLFAGANIKFVQERLHDVYSTVIALDMGGVYFPEVKGGGAFRIGACVQNFGIASKFVQEEEILPLNLCLSADYARAVPGGSMLVALAGNMSRVGGLYVCAGCEYWYSEFVAFRAGYDGNSGRFSFGASIRGMSTGAVIRLDHAFVRYGSLGDTHRLSLVVGF